LLNVVVLINRITKTQLKLKKKIARKPLNQVFPVVKLKLSLLKSYGRHHYLIIRRVWRPKG